MSLSFFLFVCRLTYSLCACAYMYGSDNTGGDDRRPEMRCYKLPEQGVAGLGSKKGLVNICGHVLSCYNSIPCGVALCWRGNSLAPCCVPASPPGTAGEARWAPRSRSDRCREELEKIWLKRLHRKAHHCQNEGREGQNEGLESPSRAIRVPACALRVPESALRVSAPSPD